MSWSFLNLHISLWLFVLISPNLIHPNSTILLGLCPCFGNENLIILGSKSTVNKIHGKKKNCSLHLLAPDKTFIIILLLSKCCCEDKPCLSYRGEQMDNMHLIYGKNCNLPVQPRPIIDFFMKCSCFLSDSNASWRDQNYRLQKSI